MSMKDKREFLQAANELACSSTLNPDVILMLVFSLSAILSEMTGTNCVVQIDIPDDEF